MATNLTIPFEKTKKLFLKLKFFINFLQNF